MRQIIKGARLVMEDGVADGQELVVEDGKITYIGAGGSGDAIYDAEGRYLSPGFVDLHVHGGAGCDFADGTAEAFEKAARLHMLHGTTSLMPTLVACSEQELYRCLAAYETVKKRQTLLPELLGVHLEGPFLSAKQCGAMNPSYFLAPDPVRCLRWLNDLPGISRMTVAPELPGALELGDLLKKHGILLSIGHSDAQYDTVKKAVEHGYTHVTHLYSAMSALHRVNAYRRLGVTESAYLLDGLSVEIIADGRHLPAELLSLLVKTKNNDQIILVTDAMRGAGLPNGMRTVLGSLSKGQDVIIEDDVAFLPDRSCFAGSVCTADRCIKTMKNVGVPLHTAVNMMTKNPCKIANVHNKGYLKVGMDADLVIFDEDIHIHGVFVRGQLITVKDCIV